MARSSATDPVARSVEVIREGQTASGAYQACPTFAPYRYSWFRDGAFIADAMSRTGRAESAESFFDWCANVVEKRAGDIRSGGRLHARYTAEGLESDEEWPTFQLDGYGLWLWALRGHCERHDRSPARWEEAVALTLDYLRRHAHEPCTDWWEEREGVHAVTLACVRAGLQAWGEDADLPPPEDRLDASLLALPLLGQGEPPLAAIEEHLVGPQGGVHRHLGDTYYGGGLWVLLTAMLGVAYAEAGRTDDAHGTLEWITAHATPDGHLPEQTQDHLLAPEMLEPWIEKWGPPASPLLWSHAMFLTLAATLAEAPSPI